DVSHSISTTIPVGYLPISPALADNLPYHRMTLAADFAQNLKLQADIVRVVGEYVSLKKAGAQNYSALCLFHKEKTPSFSVHATRQFYHCFGCGQSGDVFSFVDRKSTRLNSSHEW